jgi:hypothetical protein
MNRSIVLIVALRVGKLPQYTAAIGSTFPESARKEPTMAIVSPTARNVRVAAILAFLFVLAGCGTVTIDESNAAGIFDRFAKGDLQLDVGIGKVANNTRYGDQMYEAADKQDWARLAKVVIQANAGDDIGYYYLGLAAEGLGYLKAARIYYRHSIEASGDSRMPTKCMPEDPGMYTSHFYYNSVCAGIVLPRDAYAHLAALR